MLFSNLFITLALGSVASARAIEKMDSQPPSQSQQQQPLEIPSKPSSTCKFTPSLPLPLPFTTTLPAALYTHLPSLLLKHFSAPRTLPTSSIPTISTLSLFEETGDETMNGIFLGIVYKSISASTSPAISKTTKISKTKPPPFIPASSQSQDDFDKSWGHVPVPRSRPIPESQISPSGSSSTSMQTRRCLSEAVEGVRENRLVEGTLEMPLLEGEGDVGMRMRFLVWRVD